jgi:hypothetical protein
LGFVLSGKKSKINHVNSRFNDIKRQKSVGNFTLARTAKRNFSFSAAKWSKFVKKTFMMCVCNPSMLSHCAGAVDQSRMNEQKRALFENIISTIKGPHCHLLFSIMPPLHRQNNGN